MIEPAELHPITLKRAMQKLVPVSAQPNTGIHYLSDRDAFKFIYTTNNLADITTDIGAEGILLREHIVETYIQLPELVRELVQQLANQVLKAMAEDQLMRILRTMRP